MIQWEYKVLNIGSLKGHPYFPQQDPSQGIQKALEDLGKEGWELMHVSEIDPKWRSDPESFPGGDPGRMTWESGLTLLYFKRPGKELPAGEELRKEMPEVPLAPSGSGS
jgi:hypothetical protein